jgi:hypothetical protein
MPAIKGLAIADVDCRRELTYLVSFRGTSSSVLRRNLATLHNPKRRCFIQLFPEPTAIGQTSLSKNAIKVYADLLRASEFALVPRGRSVSSFRLVEILSAGVIPVILADDWVLPFSELLDYSTFSIVIRESEWNSTLSILEAIPAERRCLLREEGFLVFQTYFASIPAQLNTLFSIVAKRKSLHFDPHN